MMWVWARGCLRGFALIALLALAATLSSAQSLDSDYPSRGAILAAKKLGSIDPSSRHTLKHKQIENVLGFVTPWNPQGYDLVEKYRGKFTAVCPVWYQLKTDGDELQRYKIHGGPPKEKDAEWYQRLRESTVDESNGQVLDPVKVLPRIALEGWTTGDFQTLLNSSLEGIAFTEAITAEVVLRGYDGLMLETGAIWALREPLRLLSQRLHEETKELLVVLPPLREDTPQENQVLLQAVREMADFVDGFQVMTYDYHGPSGAPFKPGRPMPQDSPLSRDGVRTFGPNAPLSWIERNVEGFGSQLDDATPQSVFGSSVSGGAPLEKILVGLPLYGYQYALGWLNDEGAAQLITPPSSPTSLKDAIAEEQLKSRLRAEQREETRGLHPILTQAGSPISLADVRETLNGTKALVRRDEASKENFIDFIKAREDGETFTRPDGSVVPVAWYRRAYFASHGTQRARLELVERLGVGGVALWEVGQGEEWVLDAL